MKSYIQIKVKFSAMSNIRRHEVFNWLLSEYSKDIDMNQPIEISVCPCDFNISYVSFCYNIDVAISFFASKGFNFSKFYDDIDTIVQGGCIIYEPKR